MFRNLAMTALGFMLFSLASNVASAQSPFRDDRKCATPVYGANEVTHQAKITEGPDFSGVLEVFRNVQARVRIDAVLCRSGLVTDIKVVEGSSPTVNEFVSGGVSMIRFIPAELNLHSVSQKTRFEFEIHNGAIKEITPPQTSGMVVESVNVIGNRRLSANRILSPMQTRAGELYEESRLKRDLDALLATGQFDKQSTRVFTEPGVRGGVGVYFEVHELPVVGVVSFDGLQIDPALVREAWRAAHVNLEAGTPYAPEIGKAAIQVIKQVLDAKGLSYSRVELRTDSVTQTVNLTFVITNQ